MSKEEYSNVILSIYESGFAYDAIHHLLKLIEEDRWKREENGTELHPLVELPDHEDLIDREKNQRIRLVNADALLEKAWDADTRIGYVQVVDVGDILDAPTIEMEQKKGKWVKQNPMVDTEECSECGYNILEEGFETPFCPWCGAKMDSDK